MFTIQIKTNNIKATEKSFHNLCLIIHSATIKVLRLCWQQEKTNIFHCHLIDDEVQFSYPTRYRIEEVLRSKTSRINRERKGDKKEVEQKGEKPEQFNPSCRAAAPLPPPRHRDSNFYPTSSSSSSSFLVKQ